MSRDARIAVRLVFADRGSFHDLIVHLPADIIARYDRLIDALREDPAITAEIYVDPRRLVAAHVAGHEGVAGPEGGD